MREIYLDHAATTYLDPRVKEAMVPYWEIEFANPSSVHRLGRHAKEALDNSRETVARILNCGPHEIIFAGGGTEAINLGIFGVARHYGGRDPLKSRGHLIASTIEHHAVLRCFEALESEGFDITYIRVDKDGLVDPEKVRVALRPDTLLVSIMYANNEIGTIQPIEEIAKVIREFRVKRVELIANSDNSKPYTLNPIPFFLTDSCQAAGFLPLDVKKLGVDLLALNGSKIYGPKGIGALFVRSGLQLEPVIYGGGQEKGLRSGTENIPAIVGLAKALELAEEKKEEENKRLTELRDHFISRTLKEIPGVILNGHAEKRLPSNVNISIPGIDGDTLVSYLDAEGVYAATGSACTSTERRSSHVILAIGRTDREARGAVRFTLGRRTTKVEIDEAMAIFKSIIAKFKVSIS